MPALNFDVINRRRESENRRESSIKPQNKKEETVDHFPPKPQTYAKTQ